MLTSVIRHYDNSFLSHWLLNIPHPGNVSVCRLTIAHVPYSKTLASLKPRLSALHLLEEHLSWVVMFRQEPGDQLPAGSCLWVSFLTAGRPGQDDGLRKPEVGV